MLLLSAGCDTDRFLGTKYSADAIAATAEINGVISDTRTALPVPRATVSVAGQSARTRPDGTFKLNYILGNSETYNALIPVTVSATNYLPRHLSVAVYPNGTYFTASLEYGAPIILDGSVDSTVSDTLEAPLFWGNAVVMDYQGVADIDSVLIELFYWNPDSVSGFLRRFPLRRVENLDSLTGRFRGEIPEALEAYQLTPPHFTIFAVDRFPFRVSRGFLFSRP